MRRRIFMSEHAESGDDYNNHETFEDHVNKNVTNMIRILFYILLLICITAHIWIKYVWTYFSNSSFQEVEIIFILYDLVLVHCGIFYYIWNRKRRVEFMD